MKKHMRCTLSALMGISSLVVPLAAFSAGVVATPNSGASVSQLPGGVEVINIATPDQNGLSHNQYTAFNVSESGVVVNNSYTGGPSSLTGSSIAGNANLAGGSASVILNEVVSPTASHLNGAIELLGQDAKLIIANPNGIACNGCSFNNISQATLVAGESRMSQGALEGFAISGEIKVGHKGLEASDTSALTLAANQLLIDGIVTGQNVAALAGNGFLSADAVSLTQGESAMKRNVAIDVAALGGIRGNNIRIMSTDNHVGVGVNVDGDIMANNSLNIDAYGNVVVDGFVHSGGDQVLHANNLNNSGMIKSDGTMKVVTTQDINNNHGKILSTNDMSMDVHHLNNDYGHIATAGDLTLDNRAWFFGPTNFWGSIETGGKVKGDRPGWILGFGGSLKEDTAAL
ncbi:filamentous hemagglutinin N-terminal domain-containing protein [Halomonas caseinilytica]|uniref:filamentous hemagglutinin N-terminal domain-containing protein n=1 Tax=Halomonas caseinilytica TaxID=438744 RepID=UPI0009F52A20|nr:filamentous hemagglutinin N-terminal domain-containing protein [Halomonas caseinilytica]